MKTQNSLQIYAVWSEYLLSAWRSFASLAIKNVPNEDSDQTAEMPRQIWIFPVHTYWKVPFLMLRLRAQLFKTNDFVS